MFLLMSKHLLFPVIDFYAEHLFIIWQGNLVCFHIIMSDLILRKD